MSVKCGVLVICSNMCSNEFATIKKIDLICTPMFGAVFFTVAERQEKTKCPWMDGWMNG